MDIPWQKIKTRTSFNLAQKESRACKGEGRSIEKEEQVKKSKSDARKKSKSNGREDYREKN